MPDTTVVNRTVPGIGHNLPPDEIDVLDPNQLKLRLEQDYAPLAARVIELEQGVERAPPKITDETTATAMVDFVGKQLRPLLQEIVTTHRNEKTPYWDCGRVVDDYFLTRRNRIDQAIKTIERRAQSYHDTVRAQQRRAVEEARRKAEEAQRAAEAEQRRLQGEAEARAAEGDRQGAASLGAQAEAAGERAEHAAAIVAAPAEPVRLHGDYGSTGFARKRMAWEVIDPTLIPLGYLCLDEDAVRAAVEKDGVREIPGLRIYETETFTIRS
jgi:hypothetical protein